MKRAVVPGLLLIIAGCAYFNGIYNAKAAAGAADRQWERGEEFSAADSYRVSAIKAETVLARHPRSRWRNDALYLAGRGFALAGECGQGLRRLNQFLELPDQPQERRERALVAKASCLLANRELLSADSLLGTLIQSENPDVRAEAAQWAGRVALALGDPGRAATLLAQVPGSAAAWEFLDAAFAERNYAVAESLLATRAAEGDYRSEVPNRVRALWSAGRREAVERIVNLYGRSRAATSSRAQLHLLASDLASGSGDTALARRQAAEAGRVGLTPTVEAEVRARQLALRIRELEALSDIEAAVTRDSARATGSPLFLRIKDNILLLKLALSRPTDHGAHVFVAAEIARDSLHANRLAHELFHSIERDFPDYEIAARALLAAGQLMPESASVYERRIVSRWPLSGAAVWLQQLDTDSSTVRAEDAALREAWRFAATQFADTLNARCRADSVARAGAGRGGTGGAP